MYNIVRGILFYREVNIGYTYDEQNVPHPKETPVFSSHT